MEKLELDDCVFVEKLLRFSFAEPHYNLKELILDLSKSTATISWENVFESFPCLESLCVIGASTGGENAFHMLNIASKIRQKHPWKLPLRNIDILAYQSDALKKIREEDIRLIANFNICSISIDIGTNTDISVLHTFFEICSTKVDSMKCYRNNTVAPLHLLPITNVMPVLKHFTCTDTFYKNLQFLECMPNLKTFALKNITEPEILLLPTQIISNSIEHRVELNLTTIKNLEIEYKLNESETLYITKSIPNVEKFNGPADDKTFPIMCQNWTLLNTLDITENKLTDYGLLGLLAENQINQSHNITNLKRIGIKH